jgi:hypothetical protein
MTTDIKYFPKGHKTTLTTRQIREIWRARHSGRGCAEIGCEFGITGAHVGKIYLGRRHAVETLDLRQARHRVGQ